MGVKRLLIAALTLAIPFAFAFIGGELMVRWVAPQDLSGTWLTVGPQGLILNRARARHQFGDRVVTYRINALHQRGPEPLDGTAAVLVLGDSFTFGWLLEEADSAPGVLQSLADRDLGPRKLAFLNASTGGWLPTSGRGNSIRRALAGAQCAGTSWKRHYRGSGKTTRSTWSPKGTPRI